MDSTGRSPRFYVFCFMLLAASMACSITVPDGDDDTGAAIQTKVAATLTAEAGEGESVRATENPPQPLASPTPPAPTPTALEPDVVYQGISFSYDQSLLGSLNITREDGVLDPDHPWNIPVHISFLFEDYVLPEGFHQAQIRIFDVHAFKSVNPQAAESLDRMQELLSEEPVRAEEIFVIHFWNAMRYMIAQTETVDFQNGRGVRYISQYGQAAMPVGYPHMFYTFQGLTADNAYYVSIIFPISHPSLPDPESITLDDAFYNNWENYLEETQQQLDGQTPESFVPSLLALDAVVESLRVEGPVP